MYIQVLWYSCTSFIMQIFFCTMPNISFLPLYTLKRTLNRFAQYIKLHNGATSGLFPSVSLPRTLLLCSYTCSHACVPSDPCYIEAERHRPKRSVKHCGGATCAFFMSYIHCGLNSVYKYCTFILNFLFEDKSTVTRPMVLKKRDI